MAAYDKQARTYSGITHQNELLCQTNQNHAQSKYWEIIVAGIDGDGLGPLESILRCIQFFHPYQWHASAKGTFC